MTLATGEGSMIIGSLTESELETISGGGGSADKGTRETVGGRGGGIVSGPAAGSAGDKHSGSGCPNGIRNM